MFDEDKTCACTHAVKHHYGTPLNNCNVSGCTCNAFTGISFVPDSPEVQSVEESTVPVKRKYTRRTTDKKKGRKK